MCMALWKLALDSSFPAESDEFFDDFLEHSSLLATGENRNKLLVKVKAYCELFALKKADDFTLVSQYMVENLTKEADYRKALHLKLSLTIRKLYQLFFKHLI